MIRKTGRALSLLLACGLVLTLALAGAASARAQVGGMDEPLDSSGATGHTTPMNDEAYRDTSTATSPQTSGADLIAALWALPLALCPAIIATAVVLYHQYWRPSKAGRQK